MSANEKLKIKKSSHGYHLKKYLQEYSKNTGLHGVFYIAEHRSKAERFVWILVILGSLVCCGLMISEILKKYQNSPVVVGFATKDYPIFDIPFPSVTICPESKCSVTKFNFTEVYYALGSHKEVDDDILRKFTYMSMLCSKSRNNPGYQLEDTNFKIAGSDFFDVIDELKPELKMYCWFLGEVVNCTELLQPIIVDEGICYSFNILDRNELFQNQVSQYKDFFSAENKSSSYDPDNGYNDSAGVHTYPRRALVSGADNALTIYLQHNPKDNDYMCNQFLQGYRVLIHNPMSVPRLSKSYFRVPLEKAVVAAVQPTLLATSDSVKKYSANVRHCYLQNERHLKYFKVYTQTNCLLECVTNYTLEQCDCVDFYMPRHKKTKVCGLKSAPCLEKAESQLNRLELERQILKSSTNSCDCKPSCIKLGYSVELSLSDVSWNEFFNAQDSLDVAFNPNETFFSVLSIYFKDEQFLPIMRSELYGVTDLISNFGGLLGLFTGFSLISCVEIVYYFSIRIFYNLKLYGKWYGLEHN